MQWVEEQMLPAEAAIEATTDGKSDHPHICGPRGLAQCAHQERIEAIMPVAVGPGRSKESLGIRPGPEALVRRPHDGPAVCADLSCSTRDIECGLQRYVRKAGSFTAGFAAVLLECASVTGRARQEVCCPAIT